MTYTYRWGDCRCQTDLSGVCLYGSTPRSAPVEHDDACPLRVVLPQAVAETVTFDPFQGRFVTQRPEVPPSGDTFLEVSTVSVPAFKESLGDSFIRLLTSEMARRRVTRAELARRLGSHPAHVTRLLRPGTNLTVKTMERLATALNLKVGIGLAP